MLSTFIKKTDYALLLPCLVASAMGLLCVSSALRNEVVAGGGMHQSIKTMLIGVCVGLVLSLVVSAVEFALFARFWSVWAAVSIALMIYTKFFGVAPEARQDAASWLKIGSFMFQPSEIVKIAFILTFSVHLSKLKSKITSPLQVLLLLMHAGLAAWLVRWCGDTGSAIVFVLIAVAMAAVANVHFLYFIGGTVVSAAAFVYLWVNDYVEQFQKNRILAVFHPEQFAKTDAYQQDCALRAISSGGFWGKGLFKGDLTGSAYVPLSHNDMIFSVVGEETGLFGSVFVLALLLFICVRICVLAKRSRGRIGFLFAVGVAAMLAGQSFINIGMCLRMLPVIGITLPFFSAGGSSNLCVYIAIGLLMSISRYNTQKETKRFGIAQI
jgi:rod shape determining protein RodA